MDTSSEARYRDADMKRRRKYKWRIPEMNGGGERGRCILCQLELSKDDRPVCVCVFLLAWTWLVRKTSVSEYQSLWAGRCLKAAA